MAAAMAVAAVGGAAQAVTINLAPVANPDNAADPSTGFGAVPYDYSIGTYDVTAGQYAAFLNAVAATDTYGLYNANMAVVGSGSGGTFGCGIIQSGGSGSYSYAVAAAYQNFPVNYVSFWDAARFCNWLQNGQPTGPEGPGTTETGAYTLSGYNGADGRTITRNAGATWYLPSENEWYKAAYYNASNASYWLYPTQSNTAPINILSATGTNNANLHDAYGTGNGGYTDSVNYLTPVGAFADSPGPYGTYDMGGNVWEWNEATMGPSRALRGGGWNGISDYLASSIRATNAPTYEIDCLGFRVASVLMPGDANCDGTVDGVDLNIVLSHYGQTGQTWSEGDFDGNGTVNGADLDVVLSHFNENVGSSLADVAVPEPGSIALLLVLVGGLAIWRLSEIESFPFQRCLVAQRLGQSLAD